MKNRLTETTLCLLNELQALGQAVPKLLDRASPAAREEWGKLERRMPSAAEIKAGMTWLTEAELEEMAVKARRFRDILNGTGPRAERQLSP